MRLQPLNVLEFVMLVETQGGPDKVVVGLSAERHPRPDELTFHPMPSDTHKQVLDSIKLGRLRVYEVRPRNTTHPKGTRQCARSD